MFNFLRSLLVRNGATTESVATIETKHGLIQFICCSPTTRWRAETALTKEVDTLAWIDSFDDGETLWDIGANVGVYSLYAAGRGLPVCAFEPSPGNFYTLTRNVALNRFNELISPFCVAFDAATHIDTFYQVSDEIGSALHQFGSRLDWQGKPLDTDSTQRVTMLGFSVDDFVSIFQQPVPDHLKIDVDGIEHRLIEGARQTLANSALKSLLIELDAGNNSYQQSLELIESCGLRLQQQSRLPGTSNVPFANVINHIFTRETASL
jgi:FkbM family methyltransferase